MQHKASSKVSIQYVLNLLILKRQATGVHSESLHARTASSLDVGREQDGDRQENRKAVNESKPVLTLDHGETRVCIGKGSRMWHPKICLFGIRIMGTGSYFLRTSCGRHRTCPEDPVEVTLCEGHLHL